MKQIFTFLSIVAMGVTAYAQADTDIVHIPDWNFKGALLRRHNIDTNRDGEISYGEARAYNEYILVPKRGISNLRGIEAFVNINSLDCSDNKLKSLDVSKNIKLTNLNCFYNQLSSLDLSKNTALNYLYCNNNQLSSLDVSKNTKLTDLLCFNNQLRNLDVSKNTKLTRLGCGSNKLTSIDVSKNTNLYWLFCSNNQLTSLDVSKNTNLISLECFYNQLTQLNLANGNNRERLHKVIAEGNPNLHCIQIDKGFTPPPYNSSTKEGWTKDAHANYSDNCNYPNLSTTETKAEQSLQILNPVKDNLIIKTTAKIEKIEIYNTAGHLVKVLFKGNTQVQNLAKGVYLIKVTTDKGTSTQKIIKQ